MTIINKSFAIGDTYRNNVSGDLFTVTATGTRKVIGTRCKPYTDTITFKHLKTGKRYTEDLGYAQRLLLTKC